MRLIQLRGAGGDRFKAKNRLSIGNAIGLNLYGEGMFICHT